MEAPFLARLADREPEAQGADGRWPKLHDSLVGEQTQLLSSG